MRALPAAVALGVAMAAAPALADDAGPDSGPGAAAMDAGPTIVDAPFLLGAPDVTATVSPGEVGLGERFTLFITAVYGKGVRVNLPEPLSLGPAFEVRRTDAADRRRGDGRLVREWQIEAVAWELGELAIPPVPVAFTSGGRAAAVETDPVPLRVVSVLGDADARLVRGMAPPIDLMRRDWTLAIAAGGVVGLGAAALAWRRRRGASARTRRALGSAAADALARLDELEASGLVDDDRKRAFIRMSDVVRDFLGRRYGFSPRDQTTADLTRRLDAALPASASGEVARWLEACDRVKYANHHAEAAEAHAAIAEARALVTSIARGEVARGEVARA
jgi:hypothetical protein